MHELTVLMTFAAGLAAALLLGFLAKRLNVSPIVGYLVAGIAVGPFTAGYVADQHVADQFAEIGVILLLFGVGLKFHLSELLAVWRIAVPGALFQSAMSTMAVAGLLRAMGWEWVSGIVLGISISVAIDERPCDGGCIRMIPSPISAAGWVRPAARPSVRRR